MGQIQPFVSKPQELDQASLAFPLSQGRKWRQLIEVNDIQSFEFHKCGIMYCIEQSRNQAKTEDYTQTTRKQVN
jgi:hypothetical protein